MNSTENNFRYLGIHPTTYGFGYAVFEGHRLLDWGVYRVSGDKNERSLLYLGVLIRRYEPHVVLLEDRGPQERQRSERIRHFIRAARTTIRRNGIVPMRVPRRLVQWFFEGHDATTKQEIASRIAEWFPDLSRFVPPKRKAWMPEHPRVGMFTAIALAVTFWRSQEVSSEDLETK